MELSAFSILDAYPDIPGGARDRYQDLLMLAESAERHHLSALWIAEHHFHPGGVCPAPPVLLAAAGSRTQRLRLGVMVGVLPFHSPIGFAEEYSLLDRLIGGRLNLGLGSGYIPMEFEGFGIDPATKRERFDRALEEVMAAFRGEAVSVAPGRSPPVRINVQPVQRPHPPVWIAVQRREAIPFVARRGYHLALVPYATVGSIDELRQQIGEYRAALPPGVPGRVSAALHLYAGEEPDVARQAMQRFLDSRRATQSTFYLEKVRRDPGSASVERLESQGLVGIGSAKEVGQVLERYRAAGVDEVLGIFDFGGLDPATVDGSIRELSQSGSHPTG